MTHIKLNNESLWPQILEVLRQVTPWLDLTFFEFLILENILSQSVRHMMLGGHWDPVVMAQRTGMSPKTVSTAIRKLKRHQIVIPMNDNRDYLVNCYGLVSFYLTLCQGNRSIRETKLKQLQNLIQDLAREWQAQRLPATRIEMLAPNVTRRPDRSRPLYRGSKKLTTGHLKTNEKLSMIAACMEVTLLRLSRFSEIVVFMRILDLTLGRGKFREELVTISHIQHGQEGFGTIGIPVSRRRVELALKALKDRRFIRIHKENRTAPVMSILINAPGLTALHAKEKGTWESKSVFWMTHALYEEAYLSQILLIDGENILDLTTELTPSREDLIKELLLALSSDDVDISPSGKWSMGRCPLAAWTHEGGTDDHPSFGIRIDRNGDVHYHCFTCSDGKTTPIRYLFSLVEKMSGEYPLEADAITRVARFCTEAQDDSRVELRKRPRIATPENVVPLPDSYVERFPLLQKICPSDDVQALKCQEYVVRRGINFLSLERLKVRYVPWAKEPILIFPYTDTQGRVFVLAARNVERKKGFFVWNEKIDTEAAGIRFPRLSESFAWFGLDRLDPSTRVMLVEGEMDALKLVTLGYSNVIASGSAELTATQMEALRAYPFLILGFDSDSAGRKAAERVAAFLLNQNNSPPAIEIANWNLAKRTDGNACKDPADLVDACSLDLVMTNLESLS